MALQLHIFEPQAVSHGNENVDDLVNSRWHVASACRSLMNGMVTEIGPKKKPTGGPAVSLCSLTCGLR
ncbi:hypothetical protein [Bradyrhizobium sp. Tv2a-2]|uniref:hypothetical protein n=1 Tax=Bradyrhizobium sp. Tv2a-2 TaxID=113395 RepID=UPI0012EC985E|nr:hypothetical protein [Bradyrhizobium sp. Tv2a-2]